MNAARPNPIAPTGLADFPAAPEPRSRADAEPARTGGVVGVRRLVAVHIAASLGALATATHAQTPRFDLVGKLEGSAYSTVLTVTDDGRGGGFSYNSLGHALRSFTWAPDTGRTDRTTPVDVRLDYGVMSRSLERIVVRNFGTLGASRHSFDGTTDLIPSVFGRGIAPRAVSADGNHVAGWESMGFDLRRPFVWNAATGSRLLPARPGDDAEAWGISDDGRFVVGRDTANNVGWIYSDEAGYVTLPNAIDGGHYNTDAYGVSLDGRTVLGEGAAEVSPGVFRLAPMRWIDGVPQSLGMLDGFIWGQATGMSNDGQVIVGDLWLETGGYLSFVWTDSSGLQLAPDFLRSVGFDIPADAVMQSVVVSPSGDVFGGAITASSLNYSGGFVSAIPSPGGAMIGGAILGLSVRRRR